MDGRRHALGDRDRAGLPHPARRGVGRRAPRLAGERRRRLPAVARLRLRHRRDGRRAPSGRVHHALRNHGDRRVDLRLGSGGSRSHVRDPAGWIHGRVCRADQGLTSLQHGGDQGVAPAGCVSRSRFQFRTWKTFGDGSVGFQKSTKPLDAVTPSMRPGCAPEIRQLIVSVPALPSEYSTRRIASPAVLPGMFGLDASARSQRTSPVTVYVPLPVAASLAFRVSQFPPPVAALEVPPPPAGATNVPFPVTMIFNPMWAATVGAPTLAESSSARDVEGAAIGALLSHPRARAIATTPGSLASHLLHFISASLPTVSLRMHLTEVVWARRRTSATAEGPAVVFRDTLIRKGNAGRLAGWIVGATS